MPTRSSDRRLTVSCWLSSLMKRCGAKNGPNAACTSLVRCASASSSRNRASGVRARRAQVGARMRVDDPGQDRRRLRQHLAIVGHDRRHLPAGVHRQVGRLSVVAMRHQFELVRRRRPLERDVHGERTGAGHAVELHGLVNFMGRLHRIGHDSNRRAGGLLRNGCVPPPSARPLCYVVTMSDALLISLVDADVRRRAVISHCLCAGAAARGAAGSIHVEPLEDPAELVAPLAAWRHDPGARRRRDAARADAPHRAVGRLAAGDRLCRGARTAGGGGRGARRRDRLSRLAVRARGARPGDHRHPRPRATLRHRRTAPRGSRAAGSTA